MNTEELKNALDKAGVKPHYYSLNGMSNGPYEGTAILEKDGMRWLVYIFERGNKWDEIWFTNEDEACEYLFKILTKYPNTTIYNPPNK